MYEEDLSSSLFHYLCQELGIRFLSSLANLPSNFKPYTEVYCGNGPHTYSSVPCSVRYLIPIIPSKLLDYSTLRLLYSKVNRDNYLKVLQCTDLQQLLTMYQMENLLLCSD
jgi:hypothetical protein